MTIIIRPEISSSFIVRNIETYGPRTVGAFCVMSLRLLGQARLRFVRLVMVILRLVQQSSIYDSMLFVSVVGKFVLEEEEEGRRRGIIRKYQLMHRKSMSILAQGRL